MHREMNNTDVRLWSLYGAMAVEHSMSTVTVGYLLSLVIAYTTMSMPSNVHGYTEIIRPQ